MTGRAAPHPGSGPDSYEAVIFCHHGRHPAVNRAYVDIDGISVPVCQPSCARPHPAKFSEPVLDMLRILLRREEGNKASMSIDVLDPFGGVGLIHTISLPFVHTYAVELEHEWADQAAMLGDTWCGDFFDFNQPGPRWPRFGEWDAVATSCTYGNRMADHHQARDDSKRMTYTHQLGRPLTAGNSGAMQWGPGYREFHLKAWERVHRLLAPNGLFLLNISDHVRKQEVQPVVEWHKAACRQAGFELEHEWAIGTKRMGFGQNRDVRVDCEWVLEMRKVPR
jgi:hypothetical protein